MGLNESYSHIRAQILMMDPLPPITKVFALVIHKERQRAINQNCSSNEALILATVNTKKPSSVANALSYNPKSQSNHPYCTHYNRSGHTVDRCYQLHGFPLAYKGKYKNGSGNSRPQVNQAAATVGDSSSQRALSNNSFLKSNI